MLDRIAELRQQGEAAVAGATDTAALEDVRVRFLGRGYKATLRRAGGRWVEQLTRAPSRSRP